MALAYTAPTWTDGSGEGISASNLQAISNCIEGLVQGSDKAVHNVQINGSVIILTYADGTTENFTAVDLKGISTIEKTATVDLVDTYTITFSDGTTSTFTVTNGVVGVSPEVTITPITGGTRVTITDADHPRGQSFDVMDGSSSGDMLEADYDPNEDVKDAGGIPDYVTTAISGKADTSDLDGWTTASQVSSGAVTFTGLDDSLGYDLYCEEPNVSVSNITQTGSGTSMQLVYTLSGASEGANCKLRILR